MDFRLPQEIELVRDTAREVVDNEIGPRASTVDREERFSRENWKRLAEIGFLGFLIPEEFGGTATPDAPNALALTVALEEINRGCAATGVAMSVQNSLIGGPIVRFGTEEQKARHLPAIAKGDCIGAYALTEPGHGSDAAGIETRAERRGDRYVLNGRKAWITNAPVAGLVIVFATVDPARRSKGITAFLVDAGTKGFRVGPKERKLGIRGAETAEIVLEDCEAPVESRLGDEGDGFRIALSTLDGGRIGIAAQAIGIAQACLDASRRYAVERTQFGKPIAEYQPIQWKIARMGVGIEASRLLARRAATLRDRGEPHTIEAAMAKLHASQVANTAATDAVQIHGGAGYCCEFPVERYFRDAKITEIYEGTSEVQHLVIGRELLKEVTP